MPPIPRTKLTRQRLAAGLRRQLLDYRYSVDVEVGHTGAIRLILIRTAALARLEGMSLDGALTAVRRGYPRTGSDEEVR
jgi:hypothetical protein